MLEQLFGSRTRWKLLKLFLSQPDDQFFVRELERIIDEKLNSVRRELANLEQLGVIHEVPARPDLEEEGTPSGGRQQRKFYQANPNFVLFREMKEMIKKSWLIAERSLVERVADLGNISYMLLTGRFVGDEKSETDILIIGSVDKSKLAQFMGGVAKNLGEGINYTLMTQSEYDYRMAVTDRFLYGILEREYITVIDKR